MDKVRKKNEKTQKRETKTANRLAHLISFQFLAVLLTFCIVSSVLADEQVTAIQGGDLYTITSGIIKNGTILIKDGKINRIGQNIEIPEDANIIDAKGKVVMPGLIAATAEVAIAGYRGFMGVNKIADSLDPFHFSVSLALASGVTTAFVSSGVPGGNPVGGTNAVIKTTYGDLDNMLIKEPVAENVNISNVQWLHKTNFLLNLQMAQTYLRKLDEYQKVKGQSEKVEEPKKPAGIDTYIRLLRREMPAVLGATTADDILAALELVDEFGIRMTLAGAVEGWIVAEEIAKRDVSVIITPREKRRPNEDISAPSGSTLENAAILKKAGVKFAIVPPDTAFTIWGGAGRDLMTLPIEAAFAVSGGLDEQTALEAITITAAEILGVADRLGSLQVGKDADIIILDGHPFHYNTFVEFTLINGKVLYDKKQSTYFSHITHDN